MNYQISVIIPVYNEPYTINKTLEHLNCLKTEKKMEIIVVDGHISRTTLKSIKDKKAIKIYSSRGRGIQMNAGARAARSETLLFLHADTLPPDNSPELILQTLSAPKTVAGSFDLGILSDKPIFRLIEKMVHIRSRLTRIPYGDQGIFIKKHFFDSIGGYGKIPIMEDVDLMRRVKKSGGRIKIINRKILTSPRRWEHEGAVYCTLRNWILILLYLLGVPAEKLSKHYPFNP